jgi:NADPH:quinone reductase
VQALWITEPALDTSTTSVAEDVEAPRPGPGEVSIDVAYAGVNFLDVMARRGDAGYVSRWPYVPGLEVAGTIRELGRGVTGHRVGEPVAAFTGGGGFAEVAVVAAELAVEVPPGVELEVAAAAPLVLSSAVVLLTDVVRLRPGESVLMHSASGGLGAAVARLAATLGAGLRIGVVGSESKAVAAVAAGWAHAVPTGPGAAAAIRELAPDGVDVVLDPTGTLNLDLDLEIAAPGGRIVLFGNPAGGVPAPLPPMGRLIAGNLGLLGFSISNLRRVAPLRLRAALRESLRLLAEGRVTLEVTVVDGLTAAPEVYELLAARRGSGKYVIHVG